MQPFVSVIIPVRNEEKHIAGCIESVMSQTYPGTLFEVLLIDGMSEDNTREIIRGYSEKNPQIKMVDNQKKIVPSAMNAGLRAARGSIIIRMDAHSTYASDYVAKCVEMLEKVDADNVGGPIQTMPGNNTLIAMAVALATSHPFGVGNSKFRTSNKAQYADTVTFGAFRREVFDRVGMFDERLERNQDIELNSRIRRAGGKIFLTPEIRSCYYNHATFRGLFRQNFRNGKWNVFTNSVCRHSLSIRHFVPLVFVSSLLGSALMALLFSPAFWMFLLVVLSYLAANIFFSIRAGRKSAGSMPFLPVAFLTLHLSYGIGSIAGILELKRWKQRQT